MLVVSCAELQVEDLVIRVAWLMKLSVKHASRSTSEKQQEVLSREERNIWMAWIEPFLSLIVVKYGATLREMRFAIQAWVAPSYPYITYLFIT